jgi:hypothetical protein
MSREPEFWGGELHVPGWLRRLRKRPPADDTPERQRERHDHIDAPVGPTGKSNPGQSALDQRGAFSIMLPSDKRRSGRR